MHFYQSKRLKKVLREEGGTHKDEKKIKQVASKSRSNEKRMNVVELLAAFREHSGMLV